MPIEKGKFAVKVLLNLVIAGIIYAIVTKILSGLNGGAVISSLISLVVLLFVVPMIFEIGGEQSLMGLVMAVPVGFAMVHLIEALFGIALPVLPGEVFMIGSASMVLAIASYSLGELITSQFMR